MNKVYLYIKGDEEIGEIIEKIRSTKEKEIILIVPENCHALLHPINVEILKNEIDRLKKEVYIDSEDKRIINLARDLNISLFLSEIEPQPIIDIRPPKTTSPSKIFNTTTGQKEDKELSVYKKSQSRLKISFPLKKIFLYTLGVSSIGFVAYFFVFILQTKAEISIFTKKTTLESINPEFKTLLVSVKDGLLMPDYKNKIIGGRYIKEELNHTVSVTTTGIALNDVGKPLLNVTFFSTYPYDIPLKEGTRLSFGDNIFKTLEAIVIPAGSNDNPGIKTVAVFLDTAADQNLELASSTDLKIMAWEENKIRAADGRLFSEIVKVKTASNFKLSTSITPEQISIVTENDITNAKQILQKSLEDLLESQLKIKYSDYIYFIDKKLLKPVEIIYVSHSPGSKSNTVSATGKISFETLMIQKNDFENFLRTLINEDVLKTNKNLKIKTLNYSINLILPFNNKDRTMSFIANVNGDLVSNINIDLLKKELVGLPIEKVEDLFSKFKKEYALDLVNIEIKLTPSWRKTLPLDPQRIIIKVY